eukprot:4227301-Pyramimonas_sp.AAC.1
MAPLQDWFKAQGKAMGRKGKGLFMPLRIALTGRMQVRKCVNKRTNKQTRVAISTPMRTLTNERRCVNFSR